MSRDPDEVWSPEYDSTWEEEGEEKPRGQREPENRRQPNCRKWMSRAARDLQNYRHSYVNDRSYQFYSSQPSQMPNLDFYQGKRCFEPDGLFISQLLDKWKKDYAILERNHSYIQWLFPLREYGMNSCAKPLTNAEIQSMKNDLQVQKLFLEAYKLMLDFYGIKLEDEKTGKVTRADNWEDRFRNLNDHSHNNLRITRILKCLGELGLEHYQAPLVKFFLEETLCNGKLQNVKRSALDYFMFTVKDKIERQKLVHFAWKNYNQDKFIWGPVEKLRAYKPPTENEQETKNCRKEEGNESEEENTINGQLENYENKTSNDGFREYSDSLSGNKMECKEASDKERSTEFIALNDRFEDKDVFSDVGCAMFSEPVPDDKDQLSTSSNKSINVVLRLTNNMDRKSFGEERNPASLEVSPNENPKVPSAVGKQEEGKVNKYVIEGTLSENQHEDLQQENIPKTCGNADVHRKRKMQNVDSDRDRTVRSPSKSENPGLHKEDGDVNGVEDKVKKLSGMDFPETNVKVADDPLNSKTDRDFQQSVDCSPKNQEEGTVIQMQNEATEELVELNKQSNLEDVEEKEEPSLSTSREDPE